jgi:hypothetical protein
MGWSSGSEIMNAVIDAVTENVKDKDARKKIYGPIITALEDADWDTQDESMGIDEAFDELMAEQYPDIFDDADD